MRGPGLRADLAVALSLYRSVLAHLDRPLKTESLRTALDHLLLPARVEIFHNQLTSCLDAAHTPESMQSLRRALEEIDFPQPRALIFSLSSDKRREEVLEEASAIADEINFTRADETRSVNPEKLRDTLGRGRVIEDPVEALACTRRKGWNPVITGSFYLAGALRPHLRMSSG